MSGKIEGALVHRYPTLVGVLEQIGNVCEKLPAVSIIHAMAKGNFVGAATLTALVVPHKKYGPQQRFIEWTKESFPKRRPIAIGKAEESLTKEDMKSFLSGHTAGACDAVAFDGFLFVASLLEGEEAEKAYVITIFTIASLVAVSRWVALKHDGKDIARGAALGLVIGVTAAVASESS